MAGWCWWMNGWMDGWMTMMNGWIKMDGWMDWLIDWLADEYLVTLMWSVCKRNPLSLGIFKHSSQIWNYPRQYIVKVTEDILWGLYWKEWAASVYVCSADNNTRVYTANSYVYMCFLESGIQVQCIHTDP
jgi:hypothetical protein